MEAKTPILNCEAIENCTFPVDIILRSSDGVLLGAHTKNLELFDQSFPSVDQVQLSKEDAEVVDLSETAEILRLFFMFTHNENHHGSLHGLNFNTILELAKTSDKYGNYFGLGACLTAMDNIVAQSEVPATDCLRVLILKSRFQSFNNIDMIARHTLTVPISQAFPLFGGDIRTFYYWTHYRDTWRECIFHLHKVIAKKPATNIKVHSYMEPLVTTFIKRLETTEFPTCSDFDLSTYAFEGAYKAEYTAGDYSKSTVGKWVGELRLAVEAFPRWSTYQTVAVA